MIKKNLEESSLPVSRSNLGQVLFVIPVVVVVMQMMDLVDLKNWQDLKKTDLYHFPLTICGEIGSIVRLNFSISSSVRTGWIIRP